jgi:hypothetical protein
MLICIHSGNGFPMTDKSSFRLLTIVEAAKYLRMSDRTLRRRHDERVGPPRIEVVGKIYYSEESLIRWLKSHEQEPPRI